jgi:hypothetical protein
MKTIISFCALFLISSLLNAQTAKTNIHEADSNKPTSTVEAACGMCQFGMEDTECRLAVRIDGKAYFVEGTTIDEHGDAHAKDGFCNAIRKAAVQGEVKNGKYAATYFKLEDNTPAKKKTKKS